MPVVFRAFLFIIFLASVGLLQAQVSGTNLMEYQYGKIPGDTNAFSSLYDRAIVKYSQKSFKGGLTLEQFQSPFENRNYLKITQYELQYSSEPIEVKIGNFYETVGRGLLLRSFEIPGAILEDISYRSRHYFHRDVSGISARYQGKKLTAKLIYGKPLNYVFPPTYDEKVRRPDNIELVYAGYSLKKLNVASSLMRLTNKSQTSVFNMISLSGNPWPFLSWYVEFAKNISDYGLSTFTNQVPYAFYGSFNFSFDRLGISMEYKNYNNFLIGAGINEPPALVKEHSYKVLNRSTHVLQPQNEQGYQVEMFYTFDNSSMLTVNNTLAINNFGQRFVFQEYFAEYDSPLLQKHNLKVFADYAKDPFKLEDNRISAGAYFEWKMPKKGTIKTEYEFQTFERLNTNTTNHLMNVGYAYGSKMVFTLISEWSNDRFIVESGDKIWFGSAAKYQINRDNNIQLFAGSRRGGPACNAGICYEVLDFKGVELRLTSRF